MKRTSLLLFLILLVPIYAWTQGNAKWKTYELSQRGDTINCIDLKNQKQGIWYVYHTGEYGDADYYELGQYVDNKKQQTWRSFSKGGVLLLEENYKNNFRDGTIKYFENGYLLCLGNYKALRTDRAWDTIYVENPDTDELEKRVIPTSLGAVKHGFWTYYKAQGTEVEKVREYVIDDLVYEKEFITQSDSLEIENRQAKYPHQSNDNPPNVWILEKNRGKKPVRFTDFPENMKYVKPNVRKPKD